MNPRFRCAVPALLLAGCHAAYDDETVAHRTDALYGVRELPPDAPTGESPQTADALLAEPDLDTCLRYGLARSAPLRAAYEAWRAALERIAPASSWPDPRLTFTQFVEEIQTRTGPQQRRYGLTQTVPWLGKLAARGATATHEADAAWQRVERERLRTAETIALAFHEYAYLGESIRITASTLELLQQLEPVVQRRIQAGAGQEDLLRLQIEIGRVENDLVSRRAMQAPLAARLAAAIDLPPDRQLPFPVQHEPRAETLDTAELLARAAAGNPEIGELRERIRAAEAARDAADLERWPDLTLGVDWFETGPARAPGTPGSGDDPIGVTIGFQLPITNARYRALERGARHALASAGHALHAKLLALRADLELAVYRLADAARQLALHRDSLLPRARQALELTVTSYRTGRASLLDVIDAERAALDLETAYRRACRDQSQERARLNTLLGGDAS